MSMVGVEIAKQLETLRYIVHVHVHVHVYSSSVYVHVHVYNIQKCMYMYVASK